MLKRLISIVLKRIRRFFLDDYRKKLQDGYFNNLPEDFSLEEFKKFYDPSIDPSPEEFKGIQYMVNLKKRIDAENFNDLPEDFSEEDLDKKLENVFRHEDVSRHRNDNKED